VAFVGPTGLTGSTTFTYDISADGVNTLHIGPTGSIWLGEPEGPRLIQGGTGARDLDITFTGVSDERGVLSFTNTDFGDISGDAPTLSRYMRINVGGTPYYLPLFVLSTGTWIPYLN
jgi:hypothetical protein